MAQACVNNGGVWILADTDTGLPIRASGKIQQCVPSAAERAADTEATTKPPQQYQLPNLPGLVADERGGWYVKQDGTRATNEEVDAAANSSRRSTSSSTNVSISRTDPESLKIQQETLDYQIKNAEDAAKLARDKFDWDKATYWQNRVDSLARERSALQENQTNREFTRGENAANRSSTASEGAANRNVSLANMQQGAYDSAEARAQRAAEFALTSGLNERQYKSSIDQANANILSRKRDQDMAAAKQYADVISAVDPGAYAAFLDAGGGNIDNALAGGGTALSTQAMLPAARTKRSMDTPAQLLTYEPPSPTPAYTPGPMPQIGLSRGGGYGSLDAPGARDAETLSRGSTPGDTSIIGVGPVGMRGGKWVNLTTGQPYDNTPQSAPRWATDLAKEADYSRAGQPTDPPDAAALWRAQGGAGLEKFAAGGMTMNNEFVAGDARKRGVPNPEHVEIFDPEGNAVAYITPIRGGTQGLRKFAEGGIATPVGPSDPTKPQSFGGTGGADTNPKPPITAPIPTLTKPTSNVDQYGRTLDENGLPTEVTAMDLPYLDQVRQIREKTPYPMLNTYDVGFQNIDPLVRERFYAGRQLRYGVPVASQEALQRRYALRGLARGGFNARY